MADTRRFLACQLIALLCSGACTPAAVCPPTRPETPATVATSPTVAPTTTRRTGAPSSPIPGWFVSGSGPTSYSVGLDPAVKHGGNAAARIGATAEPPGDQFATLMQTTAPGEYLGKRVKFSAFMKTRDVANRAALWMRIDGPNKKMLGFDNMARRPIAGTTEWVEYAVVLDVPTDAVSVNFGILLVGAGTAWLDDAQLEIVDDTVAVTGGRETNEHPTNLGFEL